MQRMMMMMIRFAFLVATSFSSIIAFGDSIFPLSPKLSEGKKARENRREEEGEKAEKYSPDVGITVSLNKGVEGSSPSTLTRTINSKWRVDYN